MSEGSRPSCTPVTRSIKLIYSRGAGGLECVVGVFLRCIIGVDVCLGHERPRF